LNESSVSHDRFYLMRFPASADHTNNFRVSGISSLRQPPGSVEAAAAILRMFTLGAVPLLVPCGCATAPVPTADPYLIAVAYDVEPRFIGLEHGEAIHAIRRDFRAIAGLGFDGVVLRHVEDTDRLTLLDIAYETSLATLVPDRRFEHFVLTGTLPAACADASSLTQTLLRGIADHPARSAWVIHPGRSAAAADHAAALVASLRERRSRCTLLDGDRSAEDKGGFARIDPAVLDTELEGSPLERLIAQYHAGLSAGRTDGVVVDPYRRLPGDTHGLTSSDGPVAPAQTAAIGALVARARHWGPRLRGFTAQPIAGSTTLEGDLQIAVLIRGERRYVLVFNPAGDIYARSDVVLPQSIGGAVASRAVEVPPSTDRTVGRVVDAERGHIILSVSLRPGDAALFEIF